MNNKRINIFWFRRDLRLYDNKGLFKALCSGLDVLPIFIFDKKILDVIEDRADHRVSFIHQSLLNINGSLKKYGSSIKTFYSDPLDAFKDLTSDYVIDTVFANADYEPNALKRDEEIENFLSNQGIKFSTYKDHVIFEKSEITKDNGNPYTVFTPYKKKWLSQLEVSRDFKYYASEGKLEKLVPNREAIHELSALNFEASKITAPSAMIIDDVILSYDKTRDYPALEKGTSHLGVHLRFGTISIRELAAKAHNINQTYLNELIWRDFYSQIIFHFFYVVDTCFKKKYERIEWEHNEEHFEKWCRGLTGYPFVDAGMRQLNATGYMHNRVRMITASFLTKHLLLDYKWGEAYFAEKLFDFDLASNNGGWQWAAGCGTDAAPYFRIFNPTTQMHKFDKELKYVKKWIPELNASNYPTPIVDHKEARTKCLDRYKLALNVDNG